MKKFVDKKHLINRTKSTVNSYLHKSMLMLLFPLFFISSSCSKGIIILFDDQQISKTNLSTPAAMIHDAPEDPSSDSNLNVTISGTNIISYQYKLVSETAPCNGGGYNGTWLPSDTPIEDPIGPDDDYKLCVIGMDSFSNSQPESEATNYSWKKGYFWELEVTTTDNFQDMFFEMDGSVDLTIYWGDDEKETATSNSIEHTYSSAGVYSLKILGQASRIHFDNPDAQARLTKILSVLRGVDGITSFESTFSGCSNIEGSIPSGLFDYTPLAANFTNTFNTCFNLTGPIPPGLFDNNNQVTSFERTFYGCIGLTGSIPGALFANNPLVETFEAVFANCSGLSGPIPTGLFDNNLAAENFAYTFWYCINLAGEIPSGLFSNNSDVTEFQYTFYFCTDLTSIPSELFDNNPLVQNFTGTFAEAAGITGAVPELWNSHPGVLSHDDCFFNAVGASNYGIIPNDWK